MPGMAANVSFSIRHRRTVNRFRESRLGEQTTRWRPPVPLRRNRDNVLLGRPVAVADRLAVVLGRLAAARARPDRVGRQGRHGRVRSWVPYLLFQLSAGALVD